MINEALEFLLAQLNEYFQSKIGLSDVVLLQRLFTKEGGDFSKNNHVVFQLINIDEERIGKAQLPVAAPTGSSFPVRNPEIKLNLSIMFTAIGDNDSAEGSEPDYLISIRLLSFVIRFFQYKHVFTRQNSPSLPQSIDHLIVELHPVSLENQNYLWASLGTKYRPSAVYKVRLITVFEDGFSDFVGAPSQLDNTISNPNT
jgi:hypothetical protein